MKLSSEIFWDVNVSGIDFAKRARFVINRVMQYGTLNDWEQIVAFYGLEKIGQEMMQEPDLDPRSQAFLSIILDLPKEKFQCFKKIKMPQAPWVS